MGINLLAKQIQFQKVEALAGAFNYIKIALEVNNRHRLDEKYFTIRNAKVMAKKEYKRKFFLIYSA